MLLLNIKFKSKHKGRDTFKFGRRRAQGKPKPARQVEGKAKPPDRGVRSRCPCLNLVVHFARLKGAISLKDHV